MTPWITIPTSPITLAILIASTILTRTLTLILTLRRTNEKNGSTGSRGTKTERQETKQPLDMPEYIMLVRDRPLEYIWQEWFNGVDGAWSIMELDMWYGT